jgi:hypothetical protein
MSDEKKLTVDDIEVPEGMLDAFLEKLLEGTGKDPAKFRSWRSELAAALLWLAENPIVPNDEQANQLWHHPKTLDGDEHYSKAMARQWQQIMFLKPGPELPDELKALMFRYAGDQSQRTSPDERVLAAYKLGQTGPTHS